MVVPGEVLLRFRAGAAKPAQGDIQGYLNRLGALSVPEPLFESYAQRNSKPAVTNRLLGWYRVSIDPQVDPESWALRAQLSEGVEWAQANYLRRHAEVAGDSLRDQQWGLHAINWRPGVEAEPVVVAVIDSGVDYTHPDLAGQIWHNLSELKGVSGVDDDGNGYVDDVVGWDFTDAPGLPGMGDYLQRDADPTDESGHGTHVAGIIAAAVDNEIGISGVASNARVMALRAGFNLPSGGYLEDDDLAAAILYAVDNGARVINMSWGDPRGAPVLRDVIRYAEIAGVVLVAAAGNEGEDAVFYPARFSQTIAVGASTPKGQVLAFSNYGPSIELVAPGQAVLSLFPGGTYGPRSGTSMAAPHVAGLAALLLGYKPAWTAERVRAALRFSSRDLLVGGWDPYSGMGLAQSAVLRLSDPPHARVFYPEQDCVHEVDRVMIRMGFEGIDEWVISWGRGLDPSTWHVVAQGSASDSTEIERTWDTEGLVDGTYQVRLRARSGKRWFDDRVRLFLQRDADEVLGLRSLRELRAGRWRQVVEWETLRERPGYLVLERDGTIIHEERLAPALKQRVVLPDGLPAAIYAVQVYPEFERGEGNGYRLEGIDLHSTSVKRWPVQQASVLPKGYLLPDAVDVNGDGVAELVQMSYGRQSNYNTVDFYQQKGDTLSRIFTSLQPYIPWSLQDGDGDGLPEMLGVDAQRVRLFEAPTEGSFPRALAWEQRDVWGGEVADLDNDGIVDFFLRSSRGSYFQVFSAGGDDSYGEQAIITPPSEGTNELGQRQIIGDLDGDGRGELIGGDGDGDLFVFEAIAQDAYRSTWTLEGEGDTRTVGGGADLDGDGQREFVVARFYDDPYDLDARRWKIEVYSSFGNDKYALEWYVNVAGTTAGGSGIHTGDINGDGRVEWALVAPPDLYVFSSIEPDQYEPIWRAQAAATQRPFIGDLNGDGRDELAFNGEGQGGIYRYVAESAALYAPAYIEAYLLDSTRVQVEWQRVEGAVRYRVFRDGTTIGEVTELVFIDESVSMEGGAYSYWIQAVSEDGKFGTSSKVVQVIPQAKPRIQSVLRTSAYHLAVSFDQPMQLDEIRGQRFYVQPDVGLASSVVADRGGMRVILSFNDALPDSGLFELDTRNLRGISGAPLGNQLYPFTLAPERVRARLLRAEALDAYRVVLEFDKTVRAPEGTGHFSLGDGVVIDRVDVQGQMVILQLKEGAGIRPLGRSYLAEVNGLIDADELSVNGTATFVWASNDLSQSAPFPNPYVPEMGELLFGYLPVDATVAIYDVGGQLVRRLAETEGDGGVQWNGDNEAGVPLASGIYYYRISAGSQSKVGSLAIVR